MLKEQLERSLLMGIGLLSLTREKAQTIVEELVKQGEVARSEVKDVTNKLLERGEEERQALSKVVRKEVDGALTEMRIATQSDVEAIKKQLIDLEQQLTALSAAKGKPTAAAKDA